MSISNVIGFDLDGVIFDHTKVKQRLAKDHGFSLAERDVASDRMKKILPHDIYREIQHSLYDDPKIVLHATLWESAEKILADLLKNNIPYILISRRLNRELAVEALRAAGLHPRYFTEQTFSFVPTKKAKNEKAKQENVQIYFDDQPSVLEALTAIPSRWLFDPWDAHPEETRFGKARSWDDIAQAIAAMPSNAHVS